MQERGIGLIMMTARRWGRRRWGTLPERRPDVALRNG